MRAHSTLNIWSAKSCPYETEISPASYVPNTCIVASETNHYFTP